MLGEPIIARSVSIPRIADKFGNTWQYFPQSDRHSKIACWSILLDLLLTCQLLRTHVEEGKVGFGINHEMRDFQQDRKKKLDLVLCRRNPADEGTQTFAQLGYDYGVNLTLAEHETLQSLPVFRRAPVSNVLLALEAKACMTEHIKALPRLHDELSSSHQTIHGDTSGAIAAGFVMVNSASTFISPNRNRHLLSPAVTVLTRILQPKVTVRTNEAIMQIRRRVNDNGAGFDAIGISVINCPNDGSEVTIDLAPSTRPHPIAQYAAFVDRIAHLYATKFGAI